MAETETVGILDEIQYLVSDKLQVVSYKWLSRNFLVSSDDAKRLLQDFVEKHGTGVEVLYTLAGWKKNDPSFYQIWLASKHALSDAKQEFDGTCSVEIYSVQACLPKDPAVLGNAECVQAGELFKQPQTVDNCLRDNRVSNSHVKRNGKVTQESTVLPQVQSEGAFGPQIKTLLNQNPTPAQPKKLQVPDVVKDVKNSSLISGARERNSKPALQEEKVSEFPGNVKKVADNKSSGNGALANMWGRASSKSKIERVSAETDAQVCAPENIELQSSDDEFQGVNIKRASNGKTGRKRKVIFDASDEEDEYNDAVNLASPDPPAKPLMAASKQMFRSSDLEKNRLSFEEEKEKSAVEDSKEIDSVGNRILKEKSVAVSKDDNTKALSLENGRSNASAGTTSEHKTTDTATRSPQRRKVVKTRIDERGREVSEVVWEGDEAETKSNSSTAKKVENITASDTSSRPSANKKSPAMGTNATNQVGKAGNKKAGNKDLKQGNLMSFFKRV